MSLHRERSHPQDVEGCFACKIASVAVSADATPGRRPRTARANADERQMGKDHAAYRRLRREGLQPRTFVGADATERNARTRDEVEAGRPLPGDGNLVSHLLPQ